MQLALRVRSSALSAYAVVEERTTAISNAINSSGRKAQAMIAENAVVLRVHKTSIAIVDTLDMLIDRYLPEPEDNTVKHGSEQHKTLLPRMLYLPFKIPVRVIHISIAKGRDGRDAIQACIRHVSVFTCEKQMKLQHVLFSQTRTFGHIVTSKRRSIKNGTCPEISQSAGMNPVADEVMKEDKVLEKKLRDLIDRANALVEKRTPPRSNCSSFSAFSDVTMDDYQMFPQDCDLAALDVSAKSTSYQIPKLKIIPASGEQVQQKLREWIATRKRQIEGA